MEDSLDYKPLLYDADGCVFRYLGNNQFENITLNTKGVLDAEQQKKFLKMPFSLNVLEEINPNLSILINKLGLAFKGARRLTPIEIERFSKNK